MGQQFLNRRANDVDEKVKCLCRNSLEIRVGRKSPVPGQVASGICTRGFNYPGNA